MGDLYHADTIVALATAPGQGCVSIVRLSGPDALPIADQVFVGAQRPSSAPERAVLYGHVAGTDRTIDEVLLLVMPGPRSYTREDVVEIHGHGGRLASQAILRRIVEAGARPAEPGEFTKRAFLNGRIDLVQAEAVLDLIQAQSDRAATAAIEQLDGRLSRDFDQIYDAILAIAADLEATLDFPDDELPSLVMDQILAALREVADRQQKLIAGWDEGHLLRDGALVVISGKPNVGKSTLMNGLLGRDRAIVSAAPGTTRDSIEEALVVAGVPLRLVDTAGLRDADCDIEQEGIRRAEAHIGQADLHLLVADGSQPLSQDERDRIEKLDPRKTLILLNKSDLGLLPWPEDLDRHQPVHLSLLDGSASDRVLDAIAGVLTENHNLSGRPHAVISERHRRLLVTAQQDLQTATDLVETRREDVIVLAAASLRHAVVQLGEVTGKEYQEELIQSIFSRFCIGK